jgi:hypothetical protein
MESEGTRMGVKHGSYGKWAGPYIIGTRNSATVKMPDPEAPFMMRAFWLTIMVECLARFGVINMRDGTGVTAGLHQAPGCLPRNVKAQGSLFKLLWRIMHVLDLDNTRLGAMLKEQGWTIVGGILVNSSGTPVRGSLFRSVVTPPNGVVPSEGKQWNVARRWALAFHEVFTMRATERVQMLAGIEAMQKDICRFRTVKYLGGETLENIAFGGNALRPTPFSADEADLAHALLLSFAVNAPAWARQVYHAELKKAVRRHWKLNLNELEYDANRDFSVIVDTPDFGRRLIKSLSNKAKKWDDDVRGSRYRRSWRPARALWPEELFGPGAVMALDLPG